jgi:membrane protein involved in D-alanine export
VIPYADSLYFGVLLYPSLAAVALGIAGRLSWRWVLAINAAMLAVQYTVRADVAEREMLSKVWIVAGYGAFQWALARLFLELRRRDRARRAFGVVVVLAALPMALVKLTTASPPASLVAFLGISYVTFRALDVLFCIQDRVITTISPAQYFTFLLFFPTVSAGPLDRYRRFIADFNRTRTRAEFLADLDGAVQRLFRGLLYKFILAALVQRYWLEPVAARKGVLAVVSYMYAYSFYLFFDFAGYSAFAIGCGYLLGVHTPENFDRPFLARNIVDFWNRWHISLSTWFRDHVYTRFLMAAMRRRWFSRLTTSCIGFYVSFVLMGMWHGVAPRYFVYGLYHGTLMTAYTIAADRRKRQPALQPARAVWAPVSTLVTFHFVCVGLLIFSGRLG